MSGEVAVLGLGASGRAAAALLERDGRRAPIGEKFEPADFIDDRAPGQGAE